MGKGKGSSGGNPNYPAKAGKGPSGKNRGNTPKGK